MPDNIPFQRAGIGLPVARLLAIADMLDLALDALEGNNPRLWQMPEARGCLRNAKRHLGRILPQEAGK